MIGDNELARNPPLDANVGPRGIHVNMSPSANSIGK